MKRLLASLVLLPGLAVTATVAPAVSGNDITFHRLPVDNALSQNTVTRIAQDESGLIWISTLAGLNIFDGEEFHVVSSDPRDPNALAGVYVNNFFQDSRGRIWVAGFHGWLDSIDSATAAITHHDPALYGGRSGPTAFLETEDGLWVGTGTGLHRFDYATGTFRLRVDADRNGNQLNRITALVEGEKGWLWVGTRQGLYRYHPGTGDTRAFDPGRETPVSTTDWVVSVLYRDYDGSLWIGTPNNGVWRHSPRSSELRHYPHRPDSPGGLGSDNVTDILRDQLGRLWIANHAGGLSLYRDATDDFRVFRQDPDNPGGLPHDDIWSLFQDESGLIWIGTAGAGLAQINPSRSRFETLRSVPRNPNSLANAFVWDIAEDSGGNVWFATLGGLDRLDPSSGRFVHFRPHPNVNEPSVNQLQSLEFDSSGKLWVGSVDGRLYRFDPDSGAFQPFQRKGAAPGQFTTIRVWHIGRGHGNRIWVAVAEGLFAIDTESMRVVDTIEPEPDIPMAGDPVRTSLRDPDGTMWFGGGGAGLIHYDPRTGKTTTLSHDPDDASSLSHDVVRSLHADDDGNLWVGTINGLNLLRAEDREALRNRFALFSRRQGLPDNTIYGIVPDDLGRLWLSTNQGLASLDPETGTTRSFDVADGLTANEFNGGAELVGSDGRLYFGTVAGVTRFAPGRMTKNDYAPSPRLTAMNVSGEPWMNSPIAPPPTGIQLGYRQTDLDFEYTSTDYHQPENNRFMYRMEGLQRNWTEPSRKRYASFTNLPPGRYRFRVRAANNDGIWGEPETLASFTIAAPPWRQWWAYALYALALAGVLATWQRQQAMKLRRERAFSEELGQARSLAEANYQLAQRYAQYDQLTNLPNRESMLESLERYLRLARKSKDEIGILVVNMDRFKQVNDSFGLETGDRLLKTIAGRLRESLRESDYLARIGVDEFAIITQVTAQDREQDWESAMCDRLLKAIAVPFRAGDMIISPKARIGVALHPADSQRADELLNCADKAANAAKHRGVNTFQRYDASLDGGMRQSLRLESQLEAAIERQELELHYQPVTNIKDGSVAGFECLLRWTTSDGDSIPPDRFIPVAEASGLIVPLGNWVLDRACAECSRWRNAGIQAPWVSVNVSARQLADGSLPELIRKTLTQYRLPAPMLKLEITESAMLENPDATSRQMQALREIGVGIAVDDFGTGYSSLTHLKTLPLDVIKIDRSFVTDILASDQSRTITGSIIRLAREMKLQVVAEGVEDEATLNLLRSLSCDLAQGYLIARPATATRLQAEGWMPDGEQSAAR